MNPRKLHKFFALIFLLFPALSHANVIDYSYSQSITTPTGWNATFGTSVYHLTFTDNNGSLTLKTLGIGTFNMFPVTTTITSPNYLWYDFVGGSNFVVAESGVGIFTSALIPNIMGLNSPDLKICNPQDSCTYNTISGHPSLLPVPTPPAWLLMLTGLGILIPLYRRHVKAQRKGDDGAKGLAV